MPLAGLIQKTRKRFGTFPARSGRNSTAARMDHPLQSQVTVLTKRRAGQVWFPRPEKNVSGAECAPPNVRPRRSAGMPRKKRTEKNVFFVCAVLRNVPMEPGKSTAPWFRQRRQQSKKRVPSEKNANCTSDFLTGRPRRSADFISCNE